MGLRYQSTSTSATSGDSTQNSRIHVHVVEVVKVVPIKRSKRIFEILLHSSFFIPHQRKSRVVQHHYEQPGGTAVPAPCSHTHLVSLS